MRILEFNVKRQRLTKNPQCDFSGLVANSQGYLKAKFNLSEDWDDCKVVAAFSLEDRPNAFEYAALLDDDKMCDIPPAVLGAGEFYIRVYGAKHPGYRISTSKVKVKQEVN